MCDLKQSNDLVFILVQFISSTFYKKFNILDLLVSNKGKNDLGVVYPLNLNS